jgi:putative ATP-binding cassette transporter
LPNTTVVSIGHRSTLQAFHSRAAALTPEGGHFALRPGLGAAEPRPAE